MTKNLYRELLETGAAIKWSAAPEGISVPHANSELDLDDHGEFESLDEIFVSM